MTLDVRGSLKNSRKSKNPLVVVDKLFANSIDAFLIRQASSDSDLSLEISFTVRVLTSDLLGDEYDMEIECEDNGCGFDPNQLKAFITKDTSYKDDLNISGIGTCKGSGRVQYFHHFSTVSLSSTYLSDEGKVYVCLPPEDGRKAIEETDFQIVKTDTGKIGTTVTLSGVLPKIKRAVFTVENLDNRMGADGLKQYVLCNLLQRFVSLKDVLQDFKVTFHSDLAGQKSDAVLQTTDIPDHSWSGHIEVSHVEGDAKITADLIVTHYKLNTKLYNLPGNIVGLCANSAIAQNITNRYLRSKSLVNNAIEGFYHIILIEGRVFDEGVNEQRDGFDNIPEEGGDGDLLNELQVTFEDIYAVLDTTVEKLLTPPAWSKDEIVAKVGVNYCVSEDMLTHSSTRVRFGDTPVSVAKRALGNLQNMVVDETESLLRMKNAITDLAPDSDDFRRKINDLSWEYAASLKTVEMANLSQLVTRRSSLIDVLSLAVREGLKVQTDRPEDQRRKNEALIHNIFFPMRKDSTEVEDHDVWLLSEEYHYYDYITSDKPLSQLKIGDDAMFDDGVDKEIDALCGRISEENRNLRPDIAIFHKEGSIVIIEFKAPGVSLDEHENDLVEYANILAAKSRGKFDRFYGYLIGDTVKSTRLGGYKPLTGTNGWFRTIDLHLWESKTQFAIGQLYSEVLMYEDVVERARKRIEVYRRRLGFPSNIS